MKLLIDYRYINKLNTQKERYFDFTSYQLEELTCIYTVMLPLLSVREQKSDDLSSNRGGAVE